MDNAEDFETAAAAFSAAAFPPADDPVDQDDVVGMLAGGTIPDEVQVTNSSGEEVAVSIKDAVMGSMAPGANQGLLPAGIANDLALSVALGSVGLGVAVDAAGIGNRETEAVGWVEAEQEHNPDVTISPLLDNVVSQEFLEKVEEAQESVRADAALMADNVVSQEFLEKGEDAEDTSLVVSQDGLEIPLECLEHVVSQDTALMAAMVAAGATADGSAAAAEMVRACVCVVWWCKRDNAAALPRVA